MRTTRRRQALASRRIGVASRQVPRKTRQPALLKQLTSGDVLALGKAAKSRGSERLEFVHNVRVRGKALLGELIALLVSSPRIPT